MRRQGKLKWLLTQFEKHDKKVLDGKTITQLPPNLDKRALLCTGDTSDIWYTIPRQNEKWTKDKDKERVSRMLLFS